MKSEELRSRLLLNSCRVRNFSLFAFIFSLALSAQASWYWPFEDLYASSDTNRISDLMVPATTNIDAAADFAADGKFKEAQECYRAAIAALNKIEQENPERAATPEFATVRNKRAYITAALDAMLLAEARENAKAVSVTDTTDLEVKMALKPWKDFVPTYESLTNADRLVVKRLALIEEDWIRELINTVTDSVQQAVCVSNCDEIAKAKSSLATNRRKMQEAFRETALAVARLKRFSESVSAPGGVRVFDVCKKDVRKGLSACKDVWPKFSESLSQMNRELGSLYGVLMATGAKKDFPEIARHYVEKIKGRTMEDAQALADELGHLRACQTMLEEMDAGKSGVVHRGVLYRLYYAWGDEEPEVPTEEDDRGLVKDDGDRRPEVESQIDTYMEKERKGHEKTKVAAERIKARKDVERTVQKLLEDDPKSRKARLLQAGEDLRDGDTEAARDKVKALLDEKPNDGPALNMRAAIEATEGDLKAAEKTLDQAIRSSPRDYHAYYNMASVYLQKGNADGARRYYETGRSFGGPKNAELEKAVRRK